MALRKSEGKEMPLYFTEIVCVFLIDVVWVRLTSWSMSFRHILLEYSDCILCCNFGTASA
jgi:hypothetical protein